MKRLERCQTDIEKQEICIFLKNGTGVLAQGTALNVMIISSYAFEHSNTKHVMAAWYVRTGKD